MTEKTAVHTPTKEDRVRILKIYHDKGYKTYNGTTTTYFGNKNTTISFGDNYEIYDKEYFEDLGYTIITVDEAIAKLGLYERGQEVLVRDHYIRCERIYLETIEGAISPYITVQSGDEDLFRKGKQFQTEEWQEIKPLPLEPTTLELTMKDIEDKFGCPVKIINEK